MMRPVKITSLPSFQTGKKETRFLMSHDFPTVYEKDIKSMDVFEDDVWLCGWPKSGTTWAQEMVWLLSHDLNYEAARSFAINTRFPHFESSLVLTYWENVEDSLNICRSLPRPRHIKTHLVAEALPDQVWTKGAKVVYVVRNPKDAAVSLHHFQRHFLGSKSTLEESVGLFMAEDLYFEHVLGFWSLRDRPNVLFLHYEEMKADLMAVLRTTAAFLGKTYTDGELKTLENHLSAENMRKNPSVNMEDVLTTGTRARNEERDPTYQFIREAKVGSAKDEMPPEMLAKLDAWIERNLQGSDFEFKA